MIVCTSCKTSCNVLRHFRWGLGQFVGGVGVHRNLGDGGSEKVLRFKISSGWHLCLQFSHPTSHIAESYVTRNFKSSSPKFYHAQQLATTL